MSKNRTLADFISTSSVSAEEIANGAVTVVKLANTTSSNGTSLIQMSGHSTALNITPSGRIGINTSDPVVPFHIENEGMRIARNSGDAYIQLTQQGSTDISLYGGPNGFRVFNGASESLRITSSGHVGIGTTSPSGDLSLQSNNPNIRFDDSDTSNNGEITLDNTALRIEADEDNAVANSLLTFRIDGSEKMRINSSGNVGIGTTNPLSRLHVNNTSSAFYMGYGSNQDIYLQTTNGNFLFTDYNAANERMRITSSGRVGIGTASPSRQLTVSASGAALLLLESTGNDNSQLLFGDAASDTVGKVLYRHTDDRMSFQTNGTEHVHILSDGKVGIGTSSPAAVLQISKTQPILSGTNNGYGVFIYPTTSGDTYVDGITSGAGGAGVSLRSYYNSTYNKIIGGNTTTAITTFQTNGIDRMHINGEEFRYNGLKVYAKNWYGSNHVTYTFDIPVGNEGGGGQNILVLATHAHYYNFAYGCGYYAILGRRQANPGTQARVIDSWSGSNGGSWSVSNPDSSTLRLTKNAGSYTGGGWGMIYVIYPLGT